jgi:hypothetical protein
MLRSTFVVIVIKLNALGDGLNASRRRVEINAEKNDWAL